jgi:SAM-dependent methyltransferase
MATATDKPAQIFLNRVLFRMLSIPDNGPEISDRIVSFDNLTLRREPVSKANVVSEFKSLKNWQAVRIVEQLPAKPDGMLDETAMDHLLVNVHCEMQRISEEFNHGRRMSELLNPLLQAIRGHNSNGTLRVVDIGCGTGYVLRWLAAHRAVPNDVKLVGADYNPALIDEARRLATAENLSCEFRVGNAFRLEEPATVYISTGILHHFRGQELVELFAQHARGNARAFLHFDFHQSALAPIDSWLFHVVRMRQPLARHDGVLSAVRAYTARELLTAARAGTPAFASAIYGVRLWRLPIPRAFHCLIGILPRYREAFIAGLGNRAASLGVIE